MLCHSSLPFSLLTILLLLSSNFFNFSSGINHFPNIQTSPTSEFSWGTKRLLAEAPNAIEPPAVDSSLVLAAERTYRKDPLNGFKIYTGGWNLSERHYWASVGFTAVPLFVIAAICFLAFGLCLSLICLCYCCCRREPYGYSKTAYALSLISLMVFTVAAIVGCVILYTGQGKFHSSTTNTLEYIVQQANTTADNLSNVSEMLSAAKQNGVDQVFLPSNVQTDIDEIQLKINASASTLTTQTASNKKDIQDLIDSVRLALIIISGIMLLLTFLGLVFSIFGMQFLLYIVVIIGWILVTGTFILCGIFVLLHNVTADTCVAMEQWVENPSSHSALDDILPCVDSATALETLSRSKEVTSELVNVINEVITNVSNINFAPNFVPLYYNQSGPLLPLLCNPFTPDLMNRTCTAGEVDLSNATQLWQNYVCQVSPNGVCVTTGRLTPTIYSQMSASVNLSYGLYHYAPFLVDLQDCTFARQTFSEIYGIYCPGLRRYSQWIYIGLVIVSTTVMLSLIFWLIYGRERRHRIYTKRLMAKPAEGIEEEKNI